MTQNPLTLYKLIVLYMLNRVDFPLTKSQIMDFILEKEYISYLDLQLTIAELSEGKLIEEKNIRNRTQLFITPEGISTLDFFGNRISNNIKSEIDAYLKAEMNALKETVMTTADYSKSSSGEYLAHLVAKENNTPLVTIDLALPTEELAETVCKNWETKTQSIYGYIIEQLF